MTNVTNKIFEWLTSKGVSVRYDEIIYIDILRDSLELRFLIVANGVKYNLEVRGESVTEIEDIHTL